MRNYSAAVCFVLRRDILHSRPTFSNCHAQSTTMTFRFVYTTHTHARTLNISPKVPNTDTRERNYTHTAAAAGAAADTIVIVRNSSSHSAAFFGPAMHETRLITASGNAFLLLYTIDFNARPHEYDESQYSTQTVSSFCYSFQCLIPFHVYVCFVRAFVFLRWQ